MQIDVSALYNIPMIIAFSMFMAYIISKNPLNAGGELAILASLIGGIAFSALGVERAVDFYVNFQPSIYDDFFGNLGGDLLANVFLIVTVSVIAMASEDDIIKTGMARLFLSFVLLLICGIIELSIRQLATGNSIFTNPEFYHNLVLEIFVIPATFILINLYDLLVYLNDSKQMSKSDEAAALAVLFMNILAGGFLLIYVYRGSLEMFPPLQFALIGAIFTSITANDFFAETELRQWILTVIYLFVFILFILPAPIPPNAKVSLLSELVSALLILFMLPR